MKKAKNFSKNGAISLKITFFLVRNAIFFAGGLLSAAPDLSIVSKRPRARVDLTRVPSPWDGQGADLDNIHVIYVRARIVRYSYDFVVHASTTCFICHRK